MSKKALDWAESAPVTNATQRAFLMALAKYAGVEDTCFMNMQKIADICVCSKRYAREVRSQLEEAGFFTTETRPGRGEGSTNVYRLLLDRKTVFAGKNAGDKEEMGKLRGDAGVTPNGVRGDAGVTPKMPMGKLRGDAGVTLGVTLVSSTPINLEKGKGNKSKAKHIQPEDLGKNYQTTSGDEKKSEDDETKNIPIDHKLNRRINPQAPDPASDPTPDPTPQQTADPFADPALDPFGPVQVTPEGLKPPRKIEYQEILEVFADWKQITTNQGNLDINRIRIIRQALQWGYTREQLRQAFIGCTRSAWNMGHNETKRFFDDIGMILRSCAQIDMFRGFRLDPPKARHIDGDWQFNQRADNFYAMVKNMALADWEKERSDDHVLPWETSGTPAAEGQGQTINGQCEIIQGNFQK